MPFELQRKTDPKNLQLKADMADRGASKDMRMLAAGGFDAASKALAPVQLDGGKSGMDPAAVQRTAQAGVSGSGGKLPHLGSIQAAFGRHDVSAVQAYGGGKASSACEQMGAHAYASGNAVAFKGQPDLHTAAHEAAHIVQQRAGVSLSGGVGKSGDTYEKHADQVADAVVQGKSAEGLLDKHAGGGSGSAVQQQAVQMKGGFGEFLKEGAEGINTLVPGKSAKSGRGGELWEKNATKREGNSTGKSSKGQKLKVWAERIGLVMGTILAPTVTLVSAFTFTGISRVRNKKKKEQKERRFWSASSSEERLTKSIGSAASAAGALIKEMRLPDSGQPPFSTEDVQNILMFKLGLGTSNPSLAKVTPADTLFAQNAYAEIELALLERFPTIRQAFENKGLIRQQQDEDQGDVIDLDNTNTANDRSQGREN